MPNFKNDNLVWALLDNKAGHRNQVLGVVEALELPYKIIEINYNCLANLPNVLLDIIGGITHTKNITLKNIVSPWPKILIACGRRTAPIASKIKTLIPTTSYHIQIMNPGISLLTSKIDLIAVPKHDKFTKKKNMFETLGSPNHITPKFLTKIRKGLDLNYLSLPKPRVVIMIGGKNGKYSINENMIIEIFQKALKLAKNGTIMTTTSRRTPTLALKKIKELYKNIRIKKVLYNPKENMEQNPYNKFLTCADEVIVTGDSVSMLSEACSVGVPVRIYSNKQLCSKKHFSFHNNLVANKHALNFDTELTKKWSPKPLNTAKDLAKKIINVVN